MKFRTIGLVIVLLVGTVFLGGCISKKAPGAGEAVTPIKSEEAVVPEEGGTVTPEEPAGGIGKMNDDIYIELMARNNYEITKDPTAWVASDGWNNLLKQKGVTNEQFEAYLSTLEGDPTHYMQIMEAMGNRVKELQGN